MSVHMMQMVAAGKDQVLRRKMISPLTSKLQCMLDFVFTIIYFTINSLNNVQGRQNFRL